MFNCINSFGFEKHAVYPGPDSTIMHAELTLGGGMIMLGSLQDNEHSRLMKQPDEIGGAETRSVSLIVSDADAICARVHLPRSGRAHLERGHVRSVAAQIARS